MGRRTVSNLSRESGVSRETIYKHLRKLGIEKKTEYPPDEWETLKKSISWAAATAKSKKVDALNISACEIGSRFENEAAGAGVNQLSADEKSTINTRLHNAKQEYNYNRMLTVGFQRETDEYLAEHGKTTMLNHNGTLSPIPSISNLEKYVKLNITLSKLINDLESDLDLSLDGGDDPIE